MILVGIGANLPSADGTAPLLTCRAAVLRLDKLPGLRLAALSRWYATEPIPPSGQPPYVNAVAMLRVERPAADLDPAALLAALHVLEAAAGRVRGAANAARPLDLDIIAMGHEGGMVREAPDPVLPHPRAHLRGFVLAPLLDVAPDWLHPVLRRSARNLLRELPPQGVRLL